MVTINLTAEQADLLHSVLVLQAAEETIVATDLSSDSIDRHRHLALRDRIKSINEVVVAARRVIVYPDATRTGLVEQKSLMDEIFNHNLSKIQAIKALRRWLVTHGYEARGAIREVQ